MSYCLKNFVSMHLKITLIEQWESHNISQYFHHLWWPLSVATLCSVATRRTILFRKTIVSETKSFLIKPCIIRTQKQRHYANLNIHANFSWEIESEQGYRQHGFYEFYGKINYQKRFHGPIKVRKIQRTFIVLTLDLLGY